jgi:predicted transglutaminase-like cysteine proteinase
MMHSLNDLRVVNTKVNLLPYKSEVGDDWTPITEAGDDCDSYAMAKLQRLVQYGWPEKALRLACCFVEPSAGVKRDRYHAVLLADFEGQTYVLDNRYPYPMEYDTVPYEWHKLWSYDLNAWEWAQGADRSFG